MRFQFPDADDRLCRSSPGGVVVPHVTTLRVALRDVKVVETERGRSQATFNRRREDFRTKRT